MTWNGLKWIFFKKLTFGPPLSRRMLTFFESFPLSNLAKFEIKSIYNLRVCKIALFLAQTRDQELLIFVRSSVQFKLVRSTES